MADANKLTAAVRTEFGKGASRRARRDFQVPAVLYGHKTEPRHLLIGSLEFAAILRNSGTNSILTLDIEGEEQLALTKQIDVNPLTRVIEHTDLLVVRKGEKVVVEVGIHLEGEGAPGSLVTQDANYIEIEADALKLPDDFVISVEGFEIGRQFLASDIDLPSGVELISDPDTLIVNVIESPSEAALAAEEDDEVAGAIEESQEEDKAESESESEGDSEE